MPKFVAPPGSSGWFVYPPSQANVKIKASESVIGIFNLQRYFFILLNIYTV